ncbi:arginine methyl transferase [Dichomitus squalens]|uniref:Arginine methyl transferase n=1 Tax=Dichomitus squalens TaxID=114155 RepID=A0A4Q9N0H9_9APHY|nr:arginine methyl transferase [Dichomitus squalens]TBU45921.1 arginine methyl transferase [Dichomitus squalens]TBU56816.1 arginine methyl transferase [Dichomitus squalens]
MATDQSHNGGASDDETDVDVLVEQGQELVDAILRRRPLTEIKALIAAGAPVWFQDDEGTSPLHAAAYVENEELVRFLIDEGAVWNAVDNLHNTAGDVALSLNTENCYMMIRDAGIRSELLLRLLSKNAPEANSPLSLILKATDTTPAGSTDAFLDTKLEYTKDENGQDICLVKVSDNEEVGVMMGWERGIMQETVHKLCSDHPGLQSGLKILNVGFGLGIIDTLFQNLPTKPSLHVIIEPHPDVLKHIRDQGWYDKEGVQILEGKWQDFVESEELLSVGGFDVIYTDTFSEDYADLHKFFGHVPDLLEGPDSRFGFFNGLGATNATFYDVYRHVSDLHLADVGIDVEWSDVDVFEGDVDRWGKTREYFAMRTYRLPIGKMKLF